MREVGVFRQPQIFGNNKNNKQFTMYAAKTLNELISDT